MRVAIQQNFEPRTVLLNQAKAEEYYGGEKDRGRLVVSTMRDDVNVSSSVVAAAALR